MNRIIVTCSHVFIVTLLFLSASCMQKGYIKDASYNKAAKGNMIFGKFTLTSSDKSQSIDKIFYNSPIVIIQPPNSLVANTYEIKDDGYFYWELPPGEYNILGFSSRNYGFKIPVRLSFTVKEGSDNLYIGNIVLNYNNKHFSSFVSDEIDAAMLNFKSKFPIISENYIVGLAKMNDSVGVYKDMKYICAPEWGVKCDNELFGKKFNGIVPVRPEVSSFPFPSVKTVLPDFEWEPSSNNNVSYDLIIYEATQFSFDGNKDIEIPGNIFLYEENISAPKYSLTKKLNNNAKYYWSVRLREKDRVSSWSNFHYFYFYVIGASSGTNQMFSFATPE